MIIVVIMVYISVELFCIIMDFNFDISSVEAQCTFDTSVEVNTDTF